MEVSRELEGFALKMEGIWPSCLTLRGLLSLGLGLGLLWISRERSKSNLLG